MYYSLADLFSSSPKECKECYDWLNDAVCYFLLERASNSDVPVVQIRGLDRQLCKS